MSAGGGTLSVETRKGDFHLGELFLAKIVGA